MVETQERSIAEKDKTSFVTIKFAAPKSLDTSAPYRIIAFDKDATVSLTDNVLVCKQPLVRNTNHLSCWYLADAEGGAVSSAQGALLATCECIWINNKTGKTIKVKHKGWDVSEKWYCTDADVQLSYAGSIQLQTSPKSTASEVVSGAKEIAGGEEGFIMSGFVPTGSAIRNAVLVLEIDGKEVKSKPLSYDNEIKHGIPYYATADWDGNTLEWTKE